MEERESGRNREMVLAPNEYAYILDRTAGDVTVYTGPNKTSLSETAHPVLFSSKLKQFAKASLSEARITKTVAPEGWYVILKNPSKDRELLHPRKGPQDSPVLDVGRKINIPGPVSFSLWPGQMAKVVKGHHLRSNQYLIVRVYDDEVARANFDKTIVKTIEGDNEETKSSEGVKPEVAKSEVTNVLEVENLAMGKQFVIKGTEVSFYIPPTGISVVSQERSEEFVRDAVTLETLEYCILKSESGEKRYVHGPAVVFPEPTEVFETDKQNNRKFRAWELNALQGIYVKVIQAYKEREKKFEEGEELFITGEDTKIYMPRPEHAVIRYGDRKKHYAVAIPKGEARYVLDRTSGEIVLANGPQMCLLDPRTHVFVRRILDPKLVEFLYPGNEEALMHNIDLLDENLDQSKPTKRGLISGRRSKGRSTPLREQMVYSRLITDSVDGAWADEEVGTDLVGDDFSRGTQYTPPREVSLHTKYDGAVAISVWNGYAILLVSKSGKRRVVVGPKQVLLDYDETPEVLTLSTGKPKSTDRLKRTAYLLAKHNKVSDIVSVETSDLVQVELKVSYRVNFIGEDPEKWFSIENYVKFLCDHLRSRLRNIAKKFGIEKFHQNVIDIVRDAVIGAQGEGGKRTGLLFEENAMQVYDVEVLDITIGDRNIGKMLQEAQHRVVDQALQLKRARQEEKLIKEKEEIQRRVDQFRAETKILQQELAILKEKKNQEVALAARSSQKAQVDAEQEIFQATVDRDKIRSDYNLAIRAADLETDIKENDAEIKGRETILKAIQPDLVAAIQANGDQSMLRDVIQHLGPMHILGGESIADVLQKALAGTPLANVLGNGNGEPKHKNVPRRTRPPSESRVED